MGISFVIEKTENKTAKLLNKILTEKNIAELQWRELSAEYRKCKREWNICKALKLQSELKTKISNYYTLDKLYKFAYETLAN